MGLGRVLSGDGDSCAAGDTGNCPLRAGELIDATGMRDPRHDRAGEPIRIPVDVAPMLRLSERGRGLKDIAPELEVSLSTVKRYLCGGCYPVAPRRGGSRWWLGWKTGSGSSFRAIAATRRRCSRS